MELNQIPQNPNNWGNVADLLNENSGKIEAETAKLNNATTKFKGYFSTSTALSAKWPSPLVGDTAWVGATYPGVVYRCDVAGTWLATTDVPSVATVDLSEYYKLSDVLDKLKLDVSTAQTLTNIGEMAWNTETETVDLKISNEVTMSIGQELFVKAKNTETTSILNGTPVYISGAQGGLKQIKKASNLTDIAEKTIGLATQDITASASGIITTMGEVHGLNTAAFAEGALIWLGANGALTATKPVDAPYHIIIGICTRSHATEGSIFVSVKESYRAQIDQLRSDLNEIIPKPDELVTEVIVGKYYQSGTSITPVAFSQFSCTNIINVELGDSFVIQGLSAETLAISYQGRLYNSDGISLMQITPNDLLPITGGYKIIVSTVGAIKMGIHFVKADAATISIKKGISIEDISVRKLNDIAIQDSKTIRASISRLIKSVKSSAVFKGFVDHNSSIPVATVDHVYMSIVDGPVFGKNISVGDLLIGNGSEFDVLYPYDVIKISDTLLNLANPETFNYAEYLDTTGYHPTASYTRCVAPIEVNIGDKICAQGLGYSDVQLGMDGIRIGGYLDSNMNLLQILYMKVGTTLDAVDEIYLNSIVQGGAFIDTVPNIQGIKYFVCNFASTIAPTNNKIMIEKSDVLNDYAVYGAKLPFINHRYLAEYAKKINLDDYIKTTDAGNTFVLKADLLDNYSNNIISEKILDKDRISMYDRGSSLKTYTSKKVGIIVAGQSNTEGRVPSANFPISYIDDLGVTTDYLDVNNQIPLSNYCKNKTSGVFNLYTKPSFWSYDAIVLSKLCHKLNDTVYMINYSQGGTSISVNGIDGGGFWTPRFEDIDAYNVSKPDNNTKLCALFEQSIRTAKSLDSNFEIRAFLWHQGEGDYMPVASVDYYKNFIEVISYIRGVVGNPTLPVIFGTISHNSAQYSSVVEAAQIKIADEDPYVYVVDMSDGTLLDAYHFDAASTEYLGTEMYKILIDSVLKI